MLPLLLDAPRKMEKRKWRQENNFHPPRLSISLTRETLRHNTPYLPSPTPFATRKSPHFASFCASQHRKIFFLLSFPFRRQNFIVFTVSRVVLFRFPKKNKKPPSIVYILAAGKWQLFLFSCENARWRSWVVEADKIDLCFHFVQINCKSECLGKQFPSVKKFNWKR